MQPPTKRSLLARLGWRRPRGRPQEPADMGTAFGMEQMLGEPAPQSLPPPQASVRRRSWLRGWWRGGGLRRGRF